MSETQRSYRQIIKATSIYGGVQVIQIIAQIIRSKVVAVLLGPEGMGIISLLNSSIHIMRDLTNFGLKVSAVKNVAEAKGNGNERRIAVILTVLKRWIWITGIFGTLLTIILSPFLSELTFGNREYTNAFIWISFSLLFSQISGGQLAILQGLRKIKYLANANLTGAIFGLAVALPLYFIWGLDGIVPAIIATSVVNMLRTWYFARKVKIENVGVSLTETINEGKEMLTMGFLLSLSGLMTTGSAYFLRVFISNLGGVDQVGLYSAGFAIINTYVGLVFTAMGTDYYPRLSAIASDNIRAKQAINQQAEITLLILAPVLLVFFVFINFGIILIYSKKFILIDSMLQWAALGMFFKAGSWSNAFIFLAKGENKIFFWNELISNIYMLGFNIIGYKLGGLDGLGISFLISYIIYFVQVVLITKLKYQFSFQKEFMKDFTLQLFLGITCFMVVKLSPNPFNYIFGGVLIIFSAVYSFFKLQKKLDLKTLFEKIFREKINN